MSDYDFSKIRGTLVYVSVQEPVKAYVEKGADPKPDEWKASVVLSDEDYVDALIEHVTEKQGKISVKKVKATDFEEKYKCPLPQDAAKNVWIVTLRKSTELGKTGKPVPDIYKPRVFQKKGAKLVDITATNLVGNGSQGAISVDVFERNDGKTSFYLKNVLVTDLVEYVSTGSDYEAGSEFEDSDASGDSGEQTSKKETKPTKEQPKKAAKKQEEVDNDDPF